MAGNPTPYREGKAVVGDYEPGARFRQNSAVAELAVLTLRGFLLWVVAPLAVLAWLVSFGWLRRREVTAGQFLGWVDLNLMVFLSRAILRPLFRDPPLWVPASQMSDVTHRLSWFDFA